jgi:hypothetical protein
MASIPSMCLTSTARASCPWVTWQRWKSVASYCRLSSLLPSFENAFKVDLTIRQMIRVIVSLQCPHSILEGWHRPPMGAWKGVDMDSLNYCQGPPCLTPLYPAGGLRPSSTPLDFPCHTIAKCLCTLPACWADTGGKKLLVDPMIRQTLNG